MIINLPPPDRIMAKYAKLLQLSAGATTVQPCQGNAGRAPSESEGTRQLAASPLAAAGPQPCASPPALPLSDSLDAGRGHACRPTAPGLEKPQRGNRTGRPAAARGAGAQGATQGFVGTGRPRRRARWGSTAHARPQCKLKPLYEAEEEAVTAGSPAFGPGPDSLSPSSSASGGRDASGV